MTASPRSQIIAVSDVGWQEYQPGISFKILWQAGHERLFCQRADAQPDLL
jgi:hypothetical protein